MPQCQSEQIIDIHDLSHDGRGVGRLPPVGKTDRGKTCFVAGALPGEQVRWQTLNSKRSFNEGRCLEVLSAAPERVEPRCRYFAECGGCELQHLESGAQLRWKENQLRTALNQAGLEAAQWLPALHANTWNYRRRTRLAVAFGKRGRVRLGFRARNSREIVDIDMCEVLDARLNALIPVLAPLAARLKHRGLRELELSAGDQSLALCLNLKTALDADELAALERDLPGVGLWQKLPGCAAQPLHETAPLVAEIGDGIEMAFSPGQFIQVNATMNRAMIKQAIDWLAPQPEQFLLDLFCGGGNFSLTFAPWVARVLGVEGAADLCQQARENAARNGLGNLEFCTADLFDAGQFDRLGPERPDLVLLDPPRAGAAELVPWLQKSGADKLLYISCHPATMLRDMQRLAPQYRIEKIGVMDMFAHTTHLEAMALLTRK